MKFDNNVAYLGYMGGSRPYSPAVLEFERLVGEVVAECAIKKWSLKDYKENNKLTNTISNRAEASLNEEIKHEFKEDYLDGIDVKIDSNGTTYTLNSKSCMARYKAYVDKNGEEKDACFFDIYIKPHDIEMKDKVNYFCCVAFAEKNLYIIESNKLIDYAQKNGISLPRGGYKVDFKKIIPLSAKKPISDELAAFYRNAYYTINPPAPRKDNGRIDYEALAKRNKDEELIEKLRNYVKKTLTIDDIDYVVYNNVNELN